MKRNLLNLEWWQRLLLSLPLVMACTAAYAAGADSDTLNDVLLRSGSVIMKWENDASAPWEVSADSTYIATPTFTTETTTTLKAKYESSYPTYLTFEKINYYLYYNSYIKFKIDGVEKEWNPISYSDGWYTYGFNIPAGSHEISFDVYISGTAIDNTSTNPFVYLRNLRAREFKELETEALREGSIPLTFQNDPEHPWLTEEGYIKSMTENLEDTSSRISTTFAIDKPSIFSYQLNIPNYNYAESYYAARVYVDGVLFRSYSSKNNSYGSLVLYPGEHTVEFENYSKYSDSNYHVEISDVRLDQNWYEVSLNQPGELGVRLLQALGDKNLQDAELVKITGSLNEADWTTMSQLTGAHAIDISNTDASEIPAKEFANCPYLSTVMMPETLKKIGYEAFMYTNAYEFRIPASLEEIGHGAWYQTPLMYMTFADNSNLRKIEYEAFYRTNLLEFIMPDSVTEIVGHYSYQAWEAFYGCAYLKKLHFSDGLKTVPYGAAHDCTALEEVHIPAGATAIRGYAFYNTNIAHVDLPDSLIEIEGAAFYRSGLIDLSIPKNVTSIGDGAFTANMKLKDVKLNSHVWDMDYTFRDCTAIETLIVPSATPPSIKNNPFDGVNRSNIKLIVPDFALQSYKTDTYWYNFTNAVAGDEASLSDYWALRGNLVLDNTHIMRGTPSVEMMNGSSLTIDTDTQQPFNEFTFHTSEGTPTSLLSLSNSVTATKLTSSFDVSSENKWFFFSPVCDVKMSDVTYSSDKSWIIRYYDGARRASQNATSGNWINVPQDSVLHRGRGYIIQAVERGTLTMPVESDHHQEFFGSTEVTLPLADNTCETAANAGWNLVANPYPCYYDIYYIDMEAPVTVWTGSTYRAYSLADGDRGDDTFVLRPMQPFFVQKSSPELVTCMPLTGRRTSTVIDRTRAMQTSYDESRLKLNLEIYGTTDSVADDYTRIVLNEDATLGYETKRDASKFMSLDTKVAQIYSLGLNNHPMAINERPYGEGSVGLGVYLPVKDERYTISAPRADRQAWLHDSETGIEHDLTAGAYTFIAGKSGYDATRFTIRFANSTSAVETLGSESIVVKSGSGRISVQSPAESSLAVYAADGTSVVSTVSNGEATEIEVPAGIYVVKVNGKTFKVLVK